MKVQKETATHSSTLAWRIPWTPQRNLVGYSPRGRRESDMTEQLNSSRSTSLEGAPVIAAMVEGVCITQQNQGG